MRLRYFAATGSCSVDAGRNADRSARHEAQERVSLVVQTGINDIGFPVDPGDRVAAGRTVKGRYHPLVFLSRSSLSVTGILNVSLTEGYRNGGSEVAPNVVG